MSLTKTSNPTRANAATDAAPGGSKSNLVGFAMQVAVFAALLGLGVLGASRGIAGFSLAMGFTAIVLMAMNALGAVGPLHWYRNTDAIRVYLISMGVRMLAVGAFTIALVLPKSFTMADAMSFVITAMIGFVVFTALEVRHLIRHQPTLLSR